MEEDTEKQGGNCRLVTKSNLLYEHGVYGAEILTGSRNGFIPHRDLSILFQWLVTLSTSLHGDAAPLPLVEVLRRCVYSLRGARNTLVSWKASAIVVRPTLVPYLSHSASPPIHVASTRSFTAGPPPISTNATPRPDIPIKHVVLALAVGTHMRDAYPTETPINYVI
ncbi:hypothetical protein BDN70DRAFT_901990 [Pholiota conissans]|uniref:Uncharacterized protein n=1 Tax=Pholiota conissans TaxID=109636 RepID=A0A9P5YN13_9AGAR|nr:hypothetical protein BDN70DRAFT_901990 [Pholiota conissans]